MEKQAAEEETTDIVSLTSKGHWLLYGKALTGVPKRHGDLFKNEIRAEYIRVLLPLIEKAKETLSHEAQAGATIRTSLSKIWRP